MGRHGGRPSLDFSGFLAGKSVHVAPKKSPPFLDKSCSSSSLSSMFRRILRSEELESPGTICSVSLGVDLQISHQFD
jgi:hypothetical protein